MTADRPGVTGHLDVGGKADEFVFLRTLFAFENAVRADGRAIGTGDWDKVNLPLVEDLQAQLIAMYAEAKAEVLS